MAVKDNINVRGFCTSAGTKALQEYKPTTDAPVVAKIKEAGAIVIGAYVIAIFIINLKLFDLNELR